MTKMKEHDRIRYEIWTEGPKATSYPNRFKLLMVIHQELSNGAYWGWPDEVTGLWAKIKWVLKNMWRDLPVPVSKTSLIELKVMGERGGEQLLQKVQNRKIDWKVAYAEVKNFRNGY